jgi:hypothetical protein
MHNKLYIVNAVLVAALAYDVVAHRKNKRLIAKVLEENEDLRACAKRNYSQAIYLASIIDAHEITFDEFDLIIINDPVVE